MPQATLRVLFLLPLAPLVGAASSPATEAVLDRRFTETVQPFVQTYCITCHDKEEPEADFDLSPYTTTASVVRGHAYWELVLDMLESGEMPPRKAKQHPAPELRREIVEWIHSLRQNEARKSAGDPGPVLARRLSNAEYDYTIHDLTGADIRPTREFPVDPANQAGFDNSGESLTMSPALLKKYLQAARTVAEHLVLKPEGFEFAAHPVVADTDRDKWGVLRIVDFYNRQPTDYADYFAAAWSYHHRAALGRPRATLADVAAETKVSAKYLTTVWTALTDPSEQVGPLATLQSLWRALPAPAAKPEPADLRNRCEEMRDFVLDLRAKLVPVVPNLTSPPIERGSQTLVMWKNRQMAANRQRFDPSALQIEGAPPPDVAAAPGPGAPAATAPDPYAPAPAAGTPAPAPSIDQTVAAVADAAAPATPPRPPRPVQNEPHILRGGVFLDPAITTTKSSATSAMAAQKNRGGDPALVVPADPAERARYEAAFARFAEIFPDAFYITERARVYLDAEREQRNAGRLLSAGLHSMTGYFRDDGPLYRLILDEQGQRELDRLWHEFEFAAFIPIRMHTSFVWFERTDSSFMRGAEFDPYRPEDKSVTTQAKIRSLSELYLAKAQTHNASELVQEAIKEHFQIVATNILAHEQARVAAEDSHLEALEAFATRAYRRPLTTRERQALREFYRESREANGVDHEEAMRDGIVSILMSPHFCYRIDLVEAAGSESHTATPPAPARTGAVFASARLPEAKPPLRPGTALLSNHALASRLSYFLWSSMPDDELLAHAAAGELHRPEVLAAQARRMLKDRRIRNLATEFGANWLDFRRFEEHNSVDRERFPTFDNDLRQAMFEEPIRFFVHVVREDRPVLDFLYGDYTFANATLAKHYGMPVPTGAPDEWVRIDRADRYERGGLLPMSVFLTANSPGLRTSPVKRGYWVARRVLGERIPPPPAEVPDLPNDEADLGHLTLREALVRHREDPSCASCHARFDSFGLVFENYGPVGEIRLTDFGGRAVDTRADFPKGPDRSGVSGLRDYVREYREGDFLDNLCRKLVAYALGRTLLLSDDALIEEMRAALAAHDHRFDSLVETIVTSPQFRTKRAPTATTRTASHP